MHQYIIVHQGSTIVLCHFVHCAFVLKATFKHNECAILAIKLAQWINMYDNNISLPANPDLHVLFTDDHIFVLCDQNSDLAKHIIILSRKKTYWQVWWSVFFCRFCWDHIVILNYCTTFRCHQIRPSSNGLAAQLL